MKGGLCLLSVRSHRRRFFRTIWSDAGIKWGSSLAASKGHEGEARNGHCWKALAMVWLRGKENRNWEEVTKGVAH